jgi:hypothetical protein
MIRAQDPFPVRRSEGQFEQAAIRPWRSADFLWIAFTLFPILAIAFILPVHPNDYWWYVRMGGEIARAGSIPGVDELSSTMSGQPYLLQPWLAAWIFWVLQSLLGIGGAVLAAGLAIAGLYVFVWLTCRAAGDSPQLASLLTLLAALASSNNWVMRPQLFAYPLFGAALYSLWRWQEGSNRTLWILPAAALLWANLHGSIPLLFFLGGAALILGRGDRRKLVSALAAAFAASLVNPRALGVWRYIFEMLGNPAVRQFSREWHPPTNEGWQAAIFFGWLLFIPVLVAGSSRRLEWSHWSWFLGLGWMALVSVRNEIWFLALLAPLSARLLYAWLEGKAPEKSQPERQRLNLLVGVALLLLPVAGLPGFRELWWAAPPPALSPATPVAAVQWLESHPDLPGSVWTELGFASYLAYAIPGRKLWIDPRFELYPVAQWERFIEISEAAPGWDRQLDEEMIELLLVNPVEQPRLLAALENSTSWCVRYRDEAAVVFSKDCLYSP